MIKLEEKKLPDINALEAIDIKDSRVQEDSRVLYNLFLCLFVATQSGAVNVTQFKYRDYTIQNGYELYITNLKLRTFARVASAITHSDFLATVGLFAGDNLIFTSRHESPRLSDTNDFAENIFTPVDLIIPNGYKLGCYLGLEFGNANAGNRSAAALTVTGQIRPATVDRAVGQNPTVSVALAQSKIAQVTV